MDKLRFHIQKFKNRKANQTFRNNNPDVKLPPDYLIYESFKIDYQKYYTESVESAKWITGHIGKHIELKNKNIHFIVASGRQYQSITDKLYIIKNKITIIAENGGLIHQVDEEPILINLSPEDVIKSIQLLVAIFMVLPMISMANPEKKKWDHEKTKTIKIK